MVPKHKSSRCRHFYYRTSFCIIVINSLLCLTHKSDIILGMCRKDTQSVWAGTGMIFLVGGVGSGSNVVIKASITSNIVSANAVS